MASASLSVLVPFIAPTIVGSIGYAGYKASLVDWRKVITEFVTGPGRTSRILLLLFVVFNLKNMPLGWTYRIFSGMYYHGHLRKSSKLNPRFLFKPMITKTHTPILEIDYNFHKSNSTYFSDIDISRNHLAMYLFISGIRKFNADPKLSESLVLDPSGNPVKGTFNVALGAVECNFRREIAPYKGYELWSRVLCWDRKWLYIITHFVPKGAAKPTEWLDPSFKGIRTRGSGDAAGGWEKKVYATAISKYVFKKGRFTVHPSIVLANSDLLPERPGGWMSGENQMGDESVDLSDINLAFDGEWDWRRVEAKRQAGMKIANGLAALDDIVNHFDGGNQGALGRFSPG